MADTTKVAIDSLEGNNALSSLGDDEGISKRIERDYPVSATESDITEMNKELGLGTTTRSTSMFAANLVKVVNYLKVRF